MFFLAATNNATQFSCCAFPCRVRAVHFAKLSSLFLHIRLLFMGTATLITLFFWRINFLITVAATTNAALTAAPAPEPAT